MNYNITEGLSTTQQRYIQIIYLLCLTHSHAHTKQIADKLEIRMPSVVDALRVLERLNLIIYRVRQPVVLTPKGTAVAKLLNIRHKAFAEFFSDTLGLDPEYSEEMACNIEHVIDDRVRSRLSDFNSFLKEDSTGLSTKIINNFKNRESLLYDTTYEENESSPKRCYKKR